MSLEFTEFRDSCSLLREKQNNEEKTLGLGYHIRFSFNLLYLAAQYIYMFSDLI